MEINLSKYAGFCDGVKRAYNMVDSLDLEKARRPVFILGSLVHNDEVNKKVEEKGIKKIGREQLFNAKLGEIGTLIITAHGSGPDVYEIAGVKGIEIFDTTCPKVTKVQGLAKVYASRGHKIIIVGDEGHKEVRGINEWGDGNALIISKEKDLKSINYKTDDRIAVLAQTTQNEDFFLRAGEGIREKYPNAEIINTTCSATHERQEEAREMAKNNDAMIIIGSVVSANSKRLFEISKSINPLSYFIEKAADLKREWFSGISKTGVTAGASAPHWIIEDVISSLKKI